MARGADQFRQSDVRFWGVVALAVAMLALLSANLSAVVPDNVFAGLHVTRIATSLSASLDQFSGELAKVRDEQAQLRAAGSQFASRVTATEQSAGEAQHEVSILEAALPRLVQTIPMGGSVDASVVTGSTNSPQHFAKTVVATEDPALPPELAAPQTTAAPSIGAPVTPRSLPARLIMEAADAASTGPTQPVAALISPEAGLASGSGAPGNSGKASAAVPVAAGTPALPAPRPALDATAAASWFAQHRKAAVGTSPVAAAPARPSVISEVASLDATETASDKASARAVPASASAPAVKPVPLAKAADNAATAEPDKPAAGANPRAVGVAVGAPVQPANALAAWQDLASKIGVMLVGTSPLLAEDPAGSTGKVLVAGPIAGIATAASLCANINRAGITCTPMPYVGTDLAPAQ